MIKVTGTDVCVVRDVIDSLLLITALELILFFTISLNLVGDKIFSVNYKRLNCPLLLKYWPL